MTVSAWLCADLMLPANTTTQNFRHSILPLCGSSATSVRYRQALANFPRKVRIGIGLCRLVVDPGQTPKRFKGYARVGGAHVVSVVGQITGQQDAVVQMQAGTDNSDHAEHQCRAIPGQRVVPARRARYV